MGQARDVAFGNGAVNTSYSYSNVSNATCPEHNFRLCSITTAGSQGIYQNVSYAYDALGNVKTIADQLIGPAYGNQSFEYDDLYRLTQATGPYDSGGTEKTINYAYDEIGNLVCNTQISHCNLAGPNYIYGKKGKPGIQPHAVTEVRAGMETTRYQYDSNGSMKSGGGRTIEYDSENRPIQIVDDVQGTTHFIYDANGGRVKKIHAGITTLYIGKLYEWSGATASSMSTWMGTKTIFAGGQRIASKPAGSGETYYYHADHLGSTRVVSVVGHTDQVNFPDGALHQELAYFPYGQTREDTNPTGGSVNHKYTSQEFDATTDLYFYNARYYDPVLGRFIQADTIVPDPANPQSFNRYSYVYNNPLNYTDPSGNSPILIGLVMGALFAGIQSDWDPEAVLIGGVAGAVGGGVYGLVPGGGIPASILAGAAAGGTAAALSGGDIGRGITMGAVAGGLTAWGGVLGGESYGWLGSAVGSGVFSEISGGQFVEGFVSNLGGQLVSKIIVSFAVSKGMAIHVSQGQQMHCSNSAPGMVGCGGVTARSSQLPDCVSCPKERAGSYLFVKNPNRITGLKIVAGFYRDETRQIYHVGPGEEFIVDMTIEFEPGTLLQGGEINLGNQGWAPLYDGYYKIIGPGWFMDVSGWTTQFDPIYYNPLDHQKRKS